MKQVWKFILACGAILLLSGCTAQLPAASATAIVGTVDEVSDGSLTITNLLTHEQESITTSTVTEVRSQISAGGPGGGVGGPGNAAGAPSATPPEMPGSDGAANPNGAANTDTTATHPEMPNEQAQGADATSASGDTGQNTSSAEKDTQVSEGDKVFVLLGANNTALRVTIMSNEPSSLTYAAAYEVSDSQTFENETLSATGTDENVVLVQDDGDATIKNATVTRESATSTGGDNASFYGVGAAILAEQGTATVENTTISTNAKGGAGVFAYGPGAAVVKNTNITTQLGQNGGIHVAGGGTLYAENVDATTYGENSAAIRSDRGSGSMIVKHGTFTSNGKGSPALYSTADIYVEDAALAATGSEALCIEGLNSAYLKNCSLEGNMPIDENGDLLWNVILYQSMSGDSAEGESNFTMDGGSLTAHAGGMFYTTNTDSEFVLRNVTITPLAQNPFLLRCTGNNNQRGWGSVGSNGATCTFTGIDQQLTGDVIWDSISKLTMYLTQGSKLIGAVVQDETYAGNGGNGSAILTIDKDSTWTVTANSYLSTLNCAGTIEDSDGKTVTIVDTAGNVLQQGESQLTITVDSYSTTADCSQAGTLAE